MIDFNKNSAFDLKPIDLSGVRGEVNGMLIPGEEMLCAFKTVRDQMVFTNKRIISIDVQGITGKRKSYSSMPYSKVQFYAVQTPGFLELVPDSEMVLWFSNGFKAVFEFKGNVDVGELSRTISEFIL